MTPNEGWGEDHMTMGPAHALKLGNGTHQHQAVYTYSSSSSPSYSVKIKIPLNLCTRVRQTLIGPEKAINYNPECQQLLQLSPGIITQCCIHNSKSQYYLFFCRCGAHETSFQTFSGALLQSLFNAFQSSASPVACAEIERKNNTGSRLEHKFLQQLQKSKQQAF
jgi:hypothetical protein